MFIKKTMLRPIEGSDPKLQLIACTYYTRDGEKNIVLSYAPWIVPLNIVADYALANVDDWDGIAETTRMYYIRPNNIITYHREAK